MGTHDPDSRDQAIDVLVEMLGEKAIDPAEFYDRLCAAVCRLTRLRRAVLLIYDPPYRAVRAVGSHGVDPSLARRLEGTLAETPLARRALEEDDLVIASGDLSEHLPERFTGIIGTRTVACVPVAAAGAWLGVIFADCDGARFELPEHERLPARTLGRAAALVASVERSTRQRERAERLSERIALTREIHDQVVQRLFGLSLVLGADGPLSADDRSRAHGEVRSVLKELRGSLDRSLAPAEHETKVRLRRLLRRLGEHDPRLQVDWEPGVRIPGRLEPLAQSVLAEALRNADKHADPSTIEVEVARHGEALSMQIANDGAADESASGGLGLRLASIEALQHEGVLEFGALGGGVWRVRLVCPIGEDDGDG